MIYEKEYRRFDAEVMDITTFAMMLYEIPEPDPGKKDFRKQKILDARKVFFQQTDYLQRIINHLGQMGA